MAKYKVNFEKLQTQAEELRKSGNTLSDLGDDLSSVINKIDGSTDSMASLKRQLQDASKNLPTVSARVISASSVLKNIAEQYKSTENANYEDISGSEFTPTTLIPQIPPIGSPLPDTYGDSVWDSLQGILGKIAIGTAVGPVGFLLSTMTDFQYNVLGGITELGGLITGASDFPKVIGEVAGKAFLVAGVALDTWQNMNGYYKKYENGEIDGMDSAFVGTTLKTLTEVALPLVGSIIAGPLGGVAGSFLYSFLDGEYTKKFGESIGEVVGDYWVDKYEDAKEVVGEVADKVVDGAKKAVDKAGDVIEDVGDKLQDGFNQAVNCIKNPIGSIISIFG